MLICNKIGYLKQIGLLIAFTLMYNVCDAHTIDYKLEPVKTSDVFWQFIVEGFKHIIPLGLDHILFVVCVCFLQTSLKKTLIQASVFTLAHSVTLCLSAFGVIALDARIVEPIIALSIVFLALENVFFAEIKPWRIATIFMFGLIHGLGFAGALSGLDMPKNDFITALLGFNLGVELGQVCIILVLFYALIKPFYKKIWYNAYLRMPICGIIAAVAAYWTVERIFFA